MAASRELQSFLASDKTLAALDRHYSRVVERILRELAQGVSRPGAARARDLLIRMRELTAQIDPTKDSTVRNWIRRWIPRAFVLGDDAATRQLQDDLRRVATEKSAEFGPVVRGFSAVNATAMKAVVASMTDSLRDVSAQLEKTLGVAVRRTQLLLHTDAAIREATVGGIVRGATGRQLSDDIARCVLEGRKDTKASHEAIKRLKEKGFKDDLIDLYDRLSRGECVTAGKRTFKIRHYANLVARTMAREAHKVGGIVRLQQNEVDHVRISNHQMLKPDECTPYAGRVYYIGPLPKDPAGFPNLKDLPNGGPPFHPNCAHVLQPYVVGIKRQASVDAAREDAGLLPRRFLGKTGAEVRELVEAMDEAALQQIAPRGVKDIAA